MRMQKWRRVRETHLSGRQIEHLRLGILPNFALLLNKELSLECKSYTRCGGHLLCFSLSVKVSTLVSSLLMKPLDSHHKFYFLKQTTSQHLSPSHIPHHTNHGPSHVLSPLEIKTRDLSSDALLSQGKALDEKSTLQSTE